MEVHFTPEQEARIAAFAAGAGTVPEALVKNAALRVLEEEVRFHAVARHGRAQAANGASCGDFEVDARFEKMLHF